jgi:hypothetical protein
MGGASNRAWNIARAMQTSGHEVVAIAAYPYYPHGRVSSRYRGRLFAREHIDGLEVIRVWIPSLKTQGYFKRLLIYAAFTFSYSIGQLLLVKRRFDIVYYVSPYPLSFFSYPAIVFGGLFGSHVFLDVADLWPEVILEIGKIRTPLATVLVNVMARFASAMSDLTTPITESILERLLELGLPRGKLRVVELAIDTEYFRPQAPKVVDERLRGRFVVEYSGIVGPKYDFASLIEAAKTIGEKNREVLIVIRGDGELMPYVKRLAQSVRNVLIMDKIEHADRVLDYLNAADVLICPMRDLRETSTIVPSKVLEYLAVGKPVVCSGRGETKNLIEEYAPGIMVEPGQPEALAQAIMELHDDKRLYRSSAENARNLAVERYGLRRLARRIESLEEGLD